MAVNIMSGCLLAVCLLGRFLQAFSQGEVFRRPPVASTVFLRPKRANAFLLEEILQGNLERECYEERCNYEEAREVFEDEAKTISFWTQYHGDGNQCLPNPCLHGGNCTNRVGGFFCSCRPPHYGHTCELEPPEEDQEKTKPQYKAPEISECPTQGPGACHQLCTADFHSYRCSCTAGFKLQRDMRSCQPEVQFPCGRIPDANSSVCHHGNCPWQVSLINSSWVELCAGVILGRRSVLTTASCLLRSGDLRPSGFYVQLGNRKVVPVGALFLHQRFQLDQHDFDLALLELTTPLNFGSALIHLCLPSKDFSENILMISGRTGMADRKGRGQNQELLYMPLGECRNQLSVSHPLSNKMFCMRRRKGSGGGSQDTPTTASRNSTGPNGANVTEERLPENSSLSFQNPEPPGGGVCGGLVPGSAVVTMEKGTAFLTGLLMSATSDCDGQVFTKVSRYLNWIRPRLQAAEKHMTAQVSLYPEMR
uniref:Protein Z, vitamin K-dependent plasma glycoprotein b n=1 Tax=Cyprinodon variegatus TaxID=28743 RepID=A0A3Q2CDG8_CYPVA